MYGRPLYYVMYGRPLYYVIRKGPLINMLSACFRNFLGFKSLQVAESMTLLDSELFHNIEVRFGLLCRKETCVD